MEAAPERFGSADSQAPAQHGADHKPRKNFIQCGQCTEFFARRTLVCPRCNRTNSRSPVILGLKFLAVVAFVCIVNWIVRSIAGTGGISGMDSVTVMPQPASATAPQPDVRF